MQFLIKDCTSLEPYADFIIIVIIIIERHKVYK